MTTTGAGRLGLPNSGKSGSWGQWAHRVAWDKWLTGFCSALWSFLGSWRTLFDRFDEDKSGYISFEEYNNALVQFGYNLTPQFVTMLYRMYDKRGNQAMSFDLFVQSCLTLKRLTDVFKRYDTDRDGFITLGFEDFLTEILQSR